MVLSKFTKIHERWKMNHVSLKPKQMGKAQHALSSVVQFSTVFSDLKGVNSHP